jgi:hypothetical protein
MPDQDMWLYQAVNGAKHVLINKKFEKFLPPNVLRVLERKTNQSYFGPDTEHPELIHWFLRNRIENI